MTAPAGYMSTGVSFGIKPSGEPDLGIVDMGSGQGGRSRMWTRDLSAEYVRINADYRT